MKKTVAACVLNLCIFSMVVFSVIYMMAGGSAGALTATRTEIFKFFTVDSNILMGIAAMVMAIEQLMVIKGKKSEVSVFSSMLVLAGTASVALTMTVTIGYLTPLTYSSLGLFGLFIGSNLFMHLIVPLVSIIVWLSLEKTDKLSFKHSFLSIIPFAVYSVYYISVTLAHIKDGVVEAGYDWYWFFSLGGGMVIVALAMVSLLAYGLGFALWKINNVLAKKDRRKAE